MPRSIRLLFPSLLIVIVISLAVSVSQAWAHASLVQSVPEANARLDRAPVLIELFFSEPLEAGFSTIEVLDMAGDRVDNDDARVDPADPLRMSVTVRSLTDGVYTVSWRALSSVDSHVTAGVFPIAVGDVDAATLAAAAQAAGSVDLSPGEALARWLSFAGILTAVGGVLFILTVWEPGIRTAGLGDTLQPNWRLVAKIALVIFIGAGLLWLLVQAGKAAGKPFAFPWQESFIQVLFTTRYGALMLVRLVAALLMLRILLSEPGRRQRWIALAFGAVALLTISLGSHAAAEADPLLPVLSDWLHLLVASFWLGGLVHFAMGMFASRSLATPERTRLTAVLIPRFSALALTSIAALVLTGVYATVLHVGSPAKLVTTVYGQALLMKLVIFAAMFALGAVNLLYTSPNMRQAAQRGGERSLLTLFRRIVTSEATLGVAVLLSVGLLTTLPTATDLETVTSLRESRTADDLEIALEITPGRVGVNTFTATVTRDGQPVDDARTVELQFTPTTSGLPPSEVQLIASGNGAYSVEGAFFSMPDAYQVQTVVRRAGVFDAFANFEFSVGTTAGVGPQYPWHRVTGILFLLLAGVFCYALWPNVSPRSRQVLLVGAPALLIALGGLTVFLYNPAPQLDVFPVNPVPPNEDSIVIGQQLYLENCLPCHGAGGLGDGPVGRTLNPPPADLTEHTAPGVHTDGRLYDWITNGFQGSVMPAFKDQLTDDERWHVVNFIRTFSPETEHTMP